MGAMKKFFGRLAPKVEREQLSGEEALKTLLTMETFRICRNSKDKERRKAARKDGKIVGLEISTGFAGMTNAEFKKEQAKNAAAAYQEDKVKAKTNKEDFHAAVDSFLADVDSFLAEAENADGQSDRMTAMSDAFKKAAAAAKAKKDGGVDKPADHSL